jgi:hypothetical protein
MSWRATAEWYWQGKTEELCPSQTPHGLTRPRTRASAVRGRRLTAWATARPRRQLLGLSRNPIVRTDHVVPYCEQKQTRPALAGSQATETTLWPRVDLQVDNILPPSSGLKPRTPAIQCIYWTAKQLLASKGTRFHGLRYFFTKQKIRQLTEGIALSEAQ